MTKQIKSGRLECAQLSRSRNAVGLRPNLLNFSRTTPDVLGSGHDKRPARQATRRDSPVDPGPAVPKQQVPPPCILVSPIKLVHRGITITPSLSGSRQAGDLREMNLGWKVYKLCLGSGFGRMERYVKSIM